MRLHVQAPAGCAFGRSSNSRSCNDSPTPFSRLRLKADVRFKIAVGQRKDHAPSRGTQSVFAGERLLFVGFLDFQQNGQAVERDTRAVVNAATQKMLRQFTNVL